MYKRPAHILGFPPDAAEQQWRLETQAISGLLPTRFEAHLRTILQWPREPGQRGGHQAAEYVAQRLQDLGYHAKLLPYLLYLRYPGHVRLAVVSPSPYTFTFVEEPPSRYTDAVPGGFVAYAGSGNVSAPVVYVHYCSLRDLKYLRQAGVDVRGKVFLIRLGQAPDDHETWTKHQLEIAEDSGATGCIFYPDPARDGYARGPVYPAGPWRSAYSVFRTNGKLGRPGDVRSPGWPSTPGAPRLPESDVQLPHLPAVSVSYGEARRILENLDGPSAPDDMQGGFDFRYRLGGGAPVVHLDVKMIGQDYRIHNVITTIPGSETPHQYVYMGTHHDSWDGGAHDNAGGVAALLTAAESMTPMLKAEHRPRRTLVLCSFDAEEVCYGGATEFVEANLHEIQRGGVAFLYVDGFTSGTDLHGSFSPALVPFYEGLLNDLPDPVMSASLFDAMVQRHGRVSFDPPGIVDTLPFYHIAGLPTAYHAFSGPNGVNHSAHDTIEYVHMQDPGHRFSIACMQVWLCGGLRLANAKMPPLDYRGYARGYIQRLSQLAPERLSPSVAKDAMELAVLLKRYGRGAGAVAKAATAYALGRLNLSVEALRGVTELLLQMERDLLTDQGPSDTPWYYHTFASPACRSTGYELATFPELTRALKQGDAARAAAALDELLHVFSRACATQTGFQSIVSREATRADT